jgi:hypothetical protein
MKDPPRCENARPRTNFRAPSRACPKNGDMVDTHGDGSKPWYLVNIKIAGQRMFIPQKIVSIGIDPYPNGNFNGTDDKNHGPKNTMDHSFLLGIYKYGRGQACPIRL